MVRISQHRPRGRRAVNHSSQGHERMPNRHGDRISMSGGSAVLKLHAMSAPALEARKSAASGEGIRTLVGIAL